MSKKQLDYIDLIKANYEEESYEYLQINTEFFRDRDWSDDILHLQEHLAPHAEVVVRGHLADRMEHLVKNAKALEAFYGEIRKEFVIRDVSIDDSFIVFQLEYGVKKSLAEEQSEQQILEFITGYIRAVHKYCERERDLRREELLSSIAEKDRIIEKSKKAYENLLKNYISDMEAAAQNYENLEKSYELLQKSKLGRLLSRYWLFRVNHRR